MGGTSHRTVYTLQTRSWRRPLCINDGPGQKCLDTNNGCSKAAPSPFLLCLALLPGGMIEFIAIGHSYCAVLVDHGLLARVRQGKQRHPPVPQDDARIPSIPEPLGGRWLCARVIRSTAALSSGVTGPRICKKPVMPHIAQPQIRVGMTVRGSGTTHTPTAQAGNPCASIGANIYEQIW
jgi:hypothetical protein